ncbi:MAG TPA: hypothetical protein VH120_12155 [Gemmataceae bacterium]|jgi:hypothetical protein|nr:hypothetical protein [Gemmataceae bacterium]
MPVAVNLSILAVAAIFYSYRDHYVAGLQKARMLRDRVTYMLWSAAQELA